MGKFFPCFIAAILNGCAFQIFREPMKVGNGPLMALYMFIFTTFILLWSVKLYPRNLRKIGKLQSLVEFFVAEFLMEDLIIDFWFPLEKFFLDSLPALAQNLEDWMSAGDWSAEVLTDFLKNETTGFYVSYVLASFFLIATLHASRIIDLRTLTQEGPRCFLKEIVHRFKIGIKRALRRFGFGKRKVKINEQKNTHHPFVPNKSRDRQQSDPCKAINHTPKSRSKLSAFWPNKGKSSSNNKGGKSTNKVCPLHKFDSDISDFDDFEDLGQMSRTSCPLS